MITPGRRRLHITLVIGFLGLLASGPVLILAGIVAATERPCWFKQFPPEYCTPTDMGPGSLAVALWVAGAIVLGIFGVAGVAAHLARHSRP
jgi:hypothetical protein